MTGLTPTLVLLIAIFVSTAHGRECTSDSVWTFECEDGKCVKYQVEAGKTATSVETCKLTCGDYATLFPQPTTLTKLGKTTVPFFPALINYPQLICTLQPCDYKTLSWYVQNAFYLFRDDLQAMYNRVKLPDHKVHCQSSKLRSRNIQIKIVIANDDVELALDTNEGYRLVVDKDTSSDNINVQIIAFSFYGARHAFETLAQLVEYDEVNNSLQMLSSADITDKPAYPYRGVLLDTSRNYFSVDSIMRIIDGLAINKMNTLHWHITDTHSFPIEIKSVPNMLKYGAYNKRKVYSHEDVKKMVQHARFRGVRILPEFDQPAHCGEGWQWGQSAGLGNLAVCVNKQPWTKFCVEPPCGQLNLANPNIYPVLGKIYKEYFDLFQPDIFHAGGDEVHFNCWNTTSEIVDYVKNTYGDLTEESYMDLWGDFLTKSTEEIVKANSNEEVPLILWTSHMTFPKYLTKYMDPKKHIIQIWSGRKNTDIANIVRKGFRTIWSTYDTLYLDCGYGNWLVEGNNWCAPYKDWKLLYNNSPRDILKKNFNITPDEEMEKNILGQEAAMWSEQVDDQSGDGKIFPRVAALGERLWTDPDHGWNEAVTRMIHHRERLVQRGIHADALQPLWCDQNEQNCVL